MNLKVKVQDDKGHAKILLYDDQKVVGIATMTWGDYADLSRLVFTFLLHQVHTSISSKLGDLIWTHAQAASENSAELAKERLLALNFNTPSVQRFCDELAKSVVQSLIDKMPEYS